MKIGIVCYPTFGGSGVVATELGIGLAEKGHEIHFITYEKPARLTSYIKNIYFHEVSYFEYPLFEYAPYETLLTSQIVDVALYESLDVLHVHYAIPHAAVAFMSKKILESKGLHLPVLTTLHGTDITLLGIDKSFKSVVEFGINQSDAVNAVSRSLRDETYLRFSINKEIDVVYNFIDLDRFKRSEKTELRKSFVKNGERIVVHTSNFRKVKRIEDVIHTFQIVQREINSKLLLIGDGPERHGAEELCRQLGICGKIIFLGKQDAVEDILSIGDLFLLPSAQESFGLAALEAMACGVPVIASKVGGLPEVVDEGQNGYLCDIGDVQTMAERALEILTDDDKLEAFRNSARQKAEQFSREAIIPAYERLYQSILKKAEAET